MAERMVERYKKKRGPISYEEMFKLIKDREGKDQIVRNDEVENLWGYHPDDVGDDGSAARQRTARFEKWLRAKHGMCCPSTHNRRLYQAGDVD